MVISIIKKISVKAVILGVLIDIIGSFAVGMSVVIVYIISSPHDIYIVFSPHDFELSSHRQKIDMSFVMSFPMLVFSLILGFLLTILSGYIAGRVAKRYEIFNGFLVGLLPDLAMLLGLRSEQSPAWFNLTAFIGNLVFAALGGYLAQRHRLATRSST